MKTNQGDAFIIFTTKMNNLCPGAVKTCEKDKYMEIL